MAGRYGFDRRGQARLLRGISSFAPSLEPLIATFAVWRYEDDAGFHAHQMLQAGVRQSAEWETLTRDGTF
jgi:hypothetical protein